MSKKRPREDLLLSLGKSSFVSKSGIEKLLNEVKDEGLPETFSRTSHYRARKSVCARDTIHGKLLDYKHVELTNGEEWDIAMLNPFALFNEQCRTSAHFCKIVSEALDRYPCSPSRPWDLILYEDGVDPSDGLAKHHTRKICVYYYSFMQFGMRALGHEEVWATMTIVRENVAKN